jgi:hypothetical protein
MMFQFNKDPDGPRVLDPSQVTPEVDGTDENPDVLATLQLVSFNVGSENIDPETKATLRLDLGKDKSSNSHLDTLFWSISAGMNLYDQHKKGTPAPEELSADLSAALGQRPVEIPGGLGEFSFEVIKHKEPKWWERVFDFLQSETGSALTSAVGFPGITTRALGFLDELVGRLYEEQPEYLFKSRPMTLALSKRAKDDFAGGLGEIVKVGSLSRGFCILARGADFSTIVDSNPVYYPHLKKIAPQDCPLEDILGGTRTELDQISYAMIRVGTRETKLQQNVFF